MFKKEILKNLEEELKEDIDYKNILILGYTLRTETEIQL
jgi:ATP-dependent protease HslVU (ClpYQ) ATPase subunit